MKKTILLMLVAMYCIAANAQLVNMETKRKGKKEGFQGAVSVSVNLKQNTKSIFQGINSIDMQYKKRGHLLLLNNDIRFMQVDNEEALVNSGFQHFRYNYTPKDGKSRLTWEFFGQHQYNHVKLLETRIISGIGPRLHLLGTDSSRFYMYLSPLLMVEYEKLYDTPDDDMVIPPDIAKTQRLKGDIILSAAIGVSKTFGISNVTYYQPQCDHWSDYRISSDTDLHFRISGRLSFSFVLSFDYDSMPPIDLSGTRMIPRLFYDLNNKVSYSF